MKSVPVLGIKTHHSGNEAQARDRAQPAPPPSIARAGENTAR